MNDERILVLGGGGPIGAALERRAAAIGRSLARKTRRQVDATDEASVRAALTATGPATVINLVNPETAPDAAAIQAAAGVAGSLTRWAAEAGVARMILASSAAVYGDGGTAPFAESDNLLGGSPYALVKIGSERALAHEAAASGLSALAMRVFNVFGEGCHRSLINKLTEDKHPELAMSENYVRDYVHVDDVADALLAACDIRHVTGVVNVATGEATDNLTLAAVAAAGSFVPVDDSIVSYSVGDPARAFSSLGWRPRHSVVAELRAQFG